MPAAVQTRRPPARPALWLWTVALVAGCCLARPDADGLRDPTVLNASAPEEVDPLDVPVWTILTFKDLNRPENWRKFKVRHGVAAYLARYNMEQNESLIEQVWHARVEMLKFKFACFDQSEQPYGIDVTTFLPIRDNCDDDPYMCANKPKDLGRRLFDAFLQKSKRKIVAFGNDGFNEYSLKKTIFLLKRQMREYASCKPNNATEELPMDYETLFKPKIGRYSAESEPKRVRYEFALRPYKSAPARKPSGN